MKLLSILFFLLVFSSLNSQEISVNITEAKISFVADMQSTKGSITGLIATIKFDKNNLKNAVISGTVNTNTLSTGNKRRDEHLKSDDYFDAKTYPTLSFTAKSIISEDGQFVMNGTLKIKNIERNETIIFKVKNNAFIGECTIQVANYDLGSFGKKKPENTNVKISFYIPVSQ